MKNSLVAGAVMLVWFAAAVGATSGYEVVAVQDGGTIVGSVKFVGTPPPRAKLVTDKDENVCGKEEKFSESLVVGSNSGVQDAVVYLNDIGKGKDWGSERAVLDQNGCQFKPHVLLVAAGAEVDILNSDGILHNFHTSSTKNRAFNVAQPKFRKKITKKFEHPEMIGVKCDAHGWMNANIVVQDHPYYVANDNEGNFRLTDVPPGEYTLKVWHETLGEKAQQVSVKPKAESAAVFELGQQ